MRYYPIQLDVRQRPCLVVGGGGVGTRKVKTLLECGAAVTVVSPEVSESLQRLSDQGKLAVALRFYEETDLEGMFLVIGATADEALNRRISADARRRNMLCNIADLPDACNFILPSIISRGDLTIAISTSGKSPAFAKHLRKKLENTFGLEYITFLRLMGSIRSRLLQEEHAPEAHKPIFEQLIDGNLLDLIKADRRSEIDALLRQVVGPGFTYDGLMAPGGEEDN